MHLQNDFKREDIIRVWSSLSFCALCTSNQGCAAHHIYGRVSNSILNSIYLCYSCHKQADGHNTFTLGDERKIKYLSIALRQSAKECYIYHKRDIEFLEKIKPDFIKASKLLTKS